MEITQASPCRARPSILGHQAQAGWAERGVGGAEQAVCGEPLVLTPHFAHSIWKTQASLAPATGCIHRLRPIPKWNLWHGPYRYQETYTLATLATTPSDP